MPDTLSDTPARLNFAAAAANAGSYAARLHARQLSEAVGDVVPTPPESPERAWSRQLGIAALGAPAAPFCTRLAPVAHGAVTLPDFSHLAAPPVPPAARPASAPAAAVPRAREAVFADLRPMRPQSPRRSLLARLFGS